MCEICKSVRYEPKDCDYEGLVADSGIGSGAVVHASLPTATVAEAAAYLTHGYWEDKGRQWHKFDVEVGDTLTVNLHGLNSGYKTFARDALKAWAEVSGLNFQETSSSSADMVFDDNKSGAYASSSILGNTVLLSHINIASIWLSI